MHLMHLRYGLLLIAVIALTACSGNDDKNEEQCAEACGARQCGPDPLCGMSCGTCETGICSADGQCVSAEPGCGNGIREDGEVCDGNDVGIQTCDSMGFAGGTLTCQDDCSGYDTTGCNTTCQPDCSQTECGADPVCGISCGTCEPGTCENGVCIDPAVGSPIIVSFTTNIQTMEPGDMLVFSAIVTDPEGVDDVIGGTLQAPAGGTYGTFATSASEGAYTLSLSWNDLDQVDAIRTPPGGNTRIFVAEFFDQAAHATTATLTISLQCEDATLAACGSNCVDISENIDHCGVCDNACPEGGICVNGVCGCSDDTTCTLGEICEENFCVPGCRDNDGCPSGEYCNDGICSQGCASDSDCTNGEICDHNTHACRIGCSLDGLSISDSFWAGSLSPDMADFYYLEDMAAYGQHLYVTDGYSDVAIIDISNPDAAEFITMVSVGSWIKDLQANSNSLWIMDGGNVHHYDVQTPSAPSLTGRALSTHWSEERIPVAFDVSGYLLYTLVYDASGTNTAWSLLTHSIDAAGNLTQESSLELGTTNDGTSGALTINGNRAVAALPTTTSGLKVINIGSATSPEVLYSIDASETQTSLALNDSLLYGVSNTTGTSWTLGSSSATPANTFAGTTTESMTIQGNYLIQAARSQGVRILNIEDASAPFSQSVVSVNDRAYDVAMAGNTLWVADYVENITRIDLPTCATP